MTTEHQHAEEVHLIGRWLHATAKPFDDCDWDGTVLTLFLRNEPIEKYTRETPTTIIQGFPPTQPCTTTSLSQGLGVRCPGKWRGLIDRSAPREVSLGAATPSDTGANRIIRQESSSHRLGIQNALDLN